MAFETGFLYAFIYLATALVAVLVGKWTGAGAVLGYLAAGAAIGPWGLGLIGGAEGEDVTHFAEFGVVLMLFLIGLELRPRMLWRMRRPLLGLGGGQVALSAIILTGIGLLCGLGWKEALAVGLVLAPSSTAIVLQSLAERGLRRSDPGNDAFSVLLFQDVAVIPIIALLPLLGTGGAHPVEGAHSSVAWLEQLGPLARALVTLAAIIGVIALSWLGMRPLFRAVAGTKQREAFTAAALLLVIGVALVMTKVGLSAALGAFIAGVVLAGSEYRHELEADLEPFKGLLLGLFFIGVGMGIDFGHIGRNLGLVLGLTLTLVLVKGVVIFLLARFNGSDNAGAYLVAAALAAGGEFAFVLISVAQGAGVIAGTTAPTVVAAVALSMAATPLLILLFGRAYHRSKAIKNNASNLPERQPDVTDEGAPVIICGFGRFGHAVGRLLRGQGFACSVLDRDAEQVDLLRELGIPIHYGDAARPDLLAAAGAADAKVLVVALKDQDAALKIAQTARAFYPHLQIFLRAHGRVDAYEFIDAGEELIYRDTLDSSLRMGTDILKHLGMDETDATRATVLYRKGDEAAMREIAAHRHDRKRFMSVGREAVRALDELMRRESPCVDTDEESNKPQE
ncbi:MAG: cation:proton antiporter [Verrucomicrobiales bacterium]|nr:cation:proton antiporter [Verrucomicrobiales bacterium]